MSNQTSKRDRRFSRLHGSRVSNIHNENGVSIWVVTAVVLFFCCVYGSTAVWEDSEVNVDAVASALPAWSLAGHGTIDLPDGALANPWVIEQPNGNFSNRPPGTFLVAVPAYLMAGAPDTFSNAPATVTAVVLTALAMGIVFITLTKLMSVNAALLAVLVLGFGTATWPISSAQLWPHGIGQLGAAIGIFGLATKRYLVSGLAFSGGILVRPPTALFAAFTGIEESVAAPNRRLRPLLAIGVTSAASMLLLMLYNKIVFGAFGITGGYAPQFADNLTAMPWNEYGRNLLATFATPRNGLFLWSPVVLVALFASIGVWKRAPAWAKASLIAGVVYLFVHARINRASGGLAFNYRYPLEPLVMMAPLMSMGAVDWVRQRGVPRLVMLFSAVISVALQAIYAFTLTCEATGPGQFLCSLRI